MACVAACSAHCRAPCYLSEELAWIRLAVRCQRHMRLVKSLRRPTCCAERNRKLANGLGELPARARRVAATPRPRRGLRPTPRQRSATALRPSRTRRPRALPRTHRACRDHFGSTFLSPSFGGDRGRGCHADGYARSARERGTRFSGLSKKPGELQGSSAPEDERREGADKNFSSWQTGVSRLFCGRRWSLTT